MVFQKGNPLVACVNNALANMKRTRRAEADPADLARQGHRRTCPQVALSRDSKILGGGGAGRAVTLALLSTLVLFAALVYGVTHAPNWPEVKAAFFDWDKYRELVPGASRAPSS